MGPECTDWSYDTEKVRPFALLDCACAGSKITEKKKTVTKEGKIFPKDINCFLNQFPNPIRLNEQINTIKMDYNSK